METDWEENQQKALYRIYVDLGITKLAADLLVRNVCRALGVTCNDDGEVISVGFHGGLPGNISEALGDLPRLEAIMLSGNGLGGTIPKSLGKLQHLEFLYLDSNELTGEIPKELGFLKSLSDLDLNHNQLEGQIPRELGQLSSLERLGLSGNQLTGGLPTELGHLRNLTMLTASENRLTGPIPVEFGQFHQLSYLSLAKNQLGGTLPREFGQLQLLESVYLNDNQITGEIPKEWCQLQRLEQLVLNRNQLTGEIPKELAQLHQLQFLILSQNQLTGRIPELKAMKQLRILLLYQNQLNGTIPALSELTDLEVVALFHNRLSGEIPEVRGLKALRSLALYNNRLHGLVPSLSELMELRELVLGQNQLHGSIPETLGKLKNLQKLELGHNHLSGPIPKELAQLKELRHLRLSENGLSGPIPPELGQLKHLAILCLDLNQLTGSIPESFGEMKDLQLLHLEGNHLTGEIPQSLWHLERIEALHLGKNRLTGTMPWLIQMKALSVLDVSGNLLSGELPRFFGTGNLLDADLSENHFVGPLAESVESLCHCCGLIMVQLRFSHNQLTGALPPCLLQMKQLNHLALNNNHLVGPIPKIQSPELVVLTLHENDLSGSIPHSLQALQHLSVLTLHGNSLDGQISDLHLTGPCLDNPTFKVRGAPCFALNSFFQSKFSKDGDNSCETVLPIFRYTAAELEEILQNCPRLCSKCQNNQAARATFHHNRFSCQVPASISNISDVHATVVMGNMVGHGRELNASWIPPAENQAFLFYSPKIWSTHVFLMSTLLALGLLAALCRNQLQSRFQQALRSLASGSASRVAASNLALLRAAACTAVICSPLLLTFLAGTGYYMCAPPLSEITIANLREDPWAEWMVVLFWSALTLLSHSILASMPQIATVKGGSFRQPEPTPQSSSRLTIFSFSPETPTTTWQLELRRVASWLLWILIVSLFSLPSILFAVAQALPAQNTSGLSQEMLSYVDDMAPFLIVAIDMFLATPLSNVYSSLSGIKADRLLMTFRLFAAWLLSLLTTIFLHENCFAGWKRFWMVCKEDSPEHDTFNWRIWNEDILATSSDMCQLKQRWWSGGRCSRSIVDGLNTLMLKKLLIRCTVQPLVLMLLWYFSRLEPFQSEDAKLSGRHLRLFWGKGPKMTGALVPLQQMALITTFMEILFFWSPLIPLLSVGVLCMAAANLFLFDVGIWNFRVQLPTNAVNQQAALSRSYLTLTMIGSCGFQLWHAFGAQMCGRHLLLAVHLALLLPRARWMLPLERARSFFWVEMERATEAEVIEMAIQMDLS